MFVIYNSPPPTSGSSTGKESACNVGDPGSIPGTGRSPGERIGYPLQCSWASLVTQMVKNPPAMQRPELDPWVGEIPWRREGMATHSSVLAWRIPIDRGAWRSAVHKVAKSRTQLKRLHFQFSLSCIGEGNGNLLRCSCLENPRDGEAWWATVSGVAQSRTRLGRLGSGSIGIYGLPW